MQEDLGVCSAGSAGRCLGLTINAGSPYKWIATVLEIEKAVGSGVAPLKAASIQLQGFGSGTDCRCSLGALELDTGNPNYSYNAQDSKT